MAKWQEIWNGHFYRYVFVKLHRGIHPSNVFVLSLPGWKGDVYEGQYVCGVKCGKGRSITANGSEYVGRFSNDKRHGHGIFRLSNGAVYEGEYKNNKQDGYGFMKYWYVHVLYRTLEKHTKFRALNYYCG